MAAEQAQTTVREAVGVFRTAEALQAAIDELLSSGFDRAELSLLASEAAVDRELRHRYQKVAELEDEPAVPRTFYVSPEAVGDAEGALVGGLMYIGAVAATGAVVASGGALAAVLSAAAIGGGAGGVIGSVFARILGNRHSHHLQEQLDHGGLLLWVRTWDSGDE